MTIEAQAEAPAENGDHHIPDVRADQAMRLAAIMVCNLISSCVPDSDAEDDKKKAAQALFAIFVYQLASFSKDKKTIAALLRITADEIERSAA